MNRLSFTCMVFLVAMHTYAYELRSSEFFHLQNGENITKVDIRSSFTHSDTIELRELTYSIFGLSLDMEIERLSKNYLVRVVMEDHKGKVYLVAEDYPMLGSEGNTIYKDFCEETALLWNVKPKTLRVYCQGAKVTIGSLRMTSSPDRKCRTSEVANELSNEIRLRQAETKRDALSKAIISQGKLWFADITSLCMLSFEDRMRVLGVPEYWNTNGIEFYSGGIFDISSLDDDEEIQELRNISKSGTTTCVESFSWKNRHGRDWLTPVKDQGQSGYCCAFTAISCLEAVTNLYFNQKLDMDLSEQEDAVCNGAISPWHGMSLYAPLSYIRDHGVCEEIAYPFVDDSIESNICRSGEIIPSENISVHNIKNINLDEQSIKRALIKYGPLASGFTRHDYSTNKQVPNHALALYGYDIVHEGDTIFQLMEYGTQGSHGLVPSFIVEKNSPFIGRTVWKFKNSYINGDYTNPQYMWIVFDKLYHMPGCIALVTPVTSLHYCEEDIVWEDVDGDGFYNWGIGDKKPSSCPSWVPDQKDGDDTNPNVGPIDEYGHTIDANPESSPIIYIATDTNSSSPSSYNNNVVVQNGATWTLSHDHSFHYGAWINVKSGCSLVIDGCTLASAKLMMEPGSKLVICNEGRIVTPVTAKFSAPLGVEIDIVSGTIM